jgi:hypothetical protein
MNPFPKLLNVAHKRLFTKPSNLAFVLLSIGNRCRDVKGGLFPISLLDTQAAKSVK